MGFDVSAVEVDANSIDVDDVGRREDRVDVTLADASAVITGRRSDDGGLCKNVVPLISACNRTLMSFSWLEYLLKRLFVS